MPQKGQVVIIFFFLGLVVPTLLVFKSLLLPGTAVWGDAPYFYQDGLKELISEPEYWTSKGNNFGGIQLGLWLYPIVFFYGILGSLLKLGNDELIRSVFYFPAIAFSFLGAYLFARFLSKDKIVVFFTTLFYVFNTYFLLLVDGGQVGVALAYGLFPLALWSLNKVYHGADSRQLAIALVINSLLSFADFRIFLVLIFTFLAWKIISVIAKEENTNFPVKCLFVFLFCVLINSYWLLPILKLGWEAPFQKAFNGESVSLLHSITLFQPHWPDNVFGFTQKPLVYFLVVPLVIFIGLLLDRSRKNIILLVLFLIFAFLAKGGGKPFGQLYEFIVGSLPFGTAFRDSTKLFIPTILFAGILLSGSLSRLSLFIPIRIFRYLFLFSAYLFLLFLIKPALTQSMSGVLSWKGLPKSYQVLKDYLAGNEGFFRVVWVPERSPYSFQSKRVNSLDGQTLVSERPFARVNQGNDPYNFLAQSSAVNTDFFQALGIKYLVLSGSSREKSPLTDSGRIPEVYGSLKDNNFLQELHLEGFDSPLFSVAGTKSHFYTVDKMYAVVGSDDIYEKIKEVNPNFEIEESGFVFVEDGKFDPRVLNGLDPSSLEVIFNSKGENDLILSYLQNRFVLPERSKSNWYIGSSSDYVKTKYELLQKGVVFKDFDYQSDISFSSVPQERQVFDLSSLSEGANTLTFRFAGSKGSKIGVSFAGEEYLVEVEKEGDMSWFVKKFDNLKKGNYKLILENRSGVVLVNVAALIPQDEWEDAKFKSQELLNTHKVYDTQQILSFGKFENRETSGEIDITGTGTLRYGGIGKKGKWLIFSDHFSNSWFLKSGSNFRASIPAYSMVNAYYFDKDGKFELINNGQEQVRWGLYISLLVASITGVYLILKS